MENPNVNSTIGARRDQRAADELLQEQAANISAITAGQIEVWQKQMALCASSMHYVGDQLAIVSRSFEQIVSTAMQGVKDTTRRTG